MDDSIWNEFPHTFSIPAIASDPHGKRESVDAQQSDGDRPNPVREILRSAHTIILTWKGDMTPRIIHMATAITPAIVTRIILISLIVPSLCTVANSSAVRFPGAAMG